MAKDPSKLLPDPTSYHVSFVADLKAKDPSKRFVDNPVLTDESQAIQTDLKYILNQNPDLNGLGLILDDTAREERLASVSIEDFIPPADHYDIFDLYNFIEHAKSQFKKLPAELRLRYNNNPLELVKAFEADETSALQDFSEYFKPLMSQSGSTPSVDRDNVSSDSSSGSSDTKAEDNKQ